MTQEVEQLMARGNWEGAFAACQSLAVEHPSSAKVQGYLGLCLYRQQNFEAAAACFRKALLLDEKFWEAALKLAQCLDRLMQYEEALEAAKAAHKLRPSDPTINVLVNGLERQVCEKPVDGWQKSTIRHNVTISSE